MEKVYIPYYYCLTSTYLFKYPSFTINLIFSHFFNIGHVSEGKIFQNYVNVDDQPPTDHSLIVIEDTGGAKIISGGTSNVLGGSVLESLSEEDDDSSAPTDGGPERGCELDSGCCCTNAESSDVSSLSGGFGGKNETGNQNGGASFSQGISSLGSNQSSSNSAMAAAMASAMAMMTPTSPRSVTTAGSMHSASGRK